MIKWRKCRARGNAHDNFDILDVVVTGPGGSVWQVLYVVIII